jgi:hypothetical protein
MEMVAAETEKKDGNARGKEGRSERGEDDAVIENAIRFAMNSHICED